MEENLQEDIYYRGRDLMEPQRKILFQKITEELNKQQGFIATILSQKEKNKEKLIKFTQKIEGLKAHQAPENQIKWRENTRLIIAHTQWTIFKILQPTFDDIFDKVAADTEWGIEYNEELRDTLRFNVVFGEKEIPWTMDGDRQNYRFDMISRHRQQDYEKRIQKYIEKMKKEKDKVWLPQDHHLITLKNYKMYGKRIAKTMEGHIKHHTETLSFSGKDKNISKHIIEKYFLYFFIQALIDTKLIFDIKSTRGGKCLDVTLHEILAYFNDKVDTPLDMDIMDIKRKLWKNTDSWKVPLDLSHENSILEDIKYREWYLNDTYFLLRRVDISTLRILIKQEYDSQEGKREKHFKLLNPAYHGYKDEVDLHQEHLKIIQEYKNTPKNEYPRIDEIIEDIQKNLAYAQNMKKEHTIFEEDVPKIESKPDHSNTEIQQKYLKRYQVPAQYRHIFGIIISNLNNYYQIKAIIRNKADTENHELLKKCHSEQDITSFCNNYKTNTYVEAELQKRRTQKWKEAKEKRFPAQVSLDL